MQLIKNVALILSIIKSIKKSTVMKNRSLSPHLTIYKPQITSLVSIFHRIAGALLASTLICFILVFHIDFCLAEYYLMYITNSYFEFFFSWFINVVLNFLIMILCFHFANGCRHLTWDLGYGLEIKNVNTTGIFVLTIASLVLFVVLI